MLELLEAIKKIIEKFIINSTSISDTIDAGDTIIPVSSTRRFQLEDEIVIYDTNILAQTGEGEIRTIECIDCNDNTLTLNEGLVDSYDPSTGYVQKIIGDRFIQGVYIGSPGKISHYPAISIAAKNKDNEWLTLESTSEEFFVDITVHVDAADFEKSYRLMHTYAKRIEAALFRSLYPLVEPYNVAILASAVSDSDTVIQVVDESTLTPGQLAIVFLESEDWLRFNKVKTVLQPNVFEMTFPVGRPFSAGDKLIAPRRHMYNAFPRGIKYGLINTESGVFEAAVVNYSASEERRRFYPYIDPLDF